MRSINYPKSCNYGDVDTVNEVSHLATAALNSIEFITAFTLGLAKEKCESVMKDDSYLINSTSPIEAGFCIALSPIRYWVDLSKNYQQFHEATVNYFDYVDTDLPLFH